MTSILRVSDALPGASLLCLAGLAAIVVASAGPASAAPVQAAPGRAVAGGAVAGGAVTGHGAPARVASGRVVKHWGAFLGGRHASIPRDLRKSPSSLALPGRVAEIATSNSSQYALLTNGKVYAWGLGNDGQLGNGRTKNSFFRPVRVRFPHGVKIASIPIDVVPFDTGLAVSRSGHVYGWGGNQFGELCLGNHRVHRLPVRLPFSHVTAIAGAGGHAVFDARGRVYSCGNNTAGELGNNSTKSSDVPVRVTALNGTKVRVLVAAFANSGALLASGKYLDWGYDGQGQVGDGKFNEAALQPVRVRLPGPVKLVAQGGSLFGNGQTLVKLRNGALYAWGADSHSQLGDRGTANQALPIEIFPPAHVRYRMLATGGATSYAISMTGKVYAWGANKAGQVGNGSRKTAVRPVRVASRATSISATAADVLISLRSRR
jgi:alpha-tubulin suppressor-like RCC1 family protein